MRSAVVGLLVAATLLSPPLAADEPESDETIATEAEPAPQPEEDDWRILAGTVFMGAGGLAIVAGTTMAVVAAAKYADLDCPDDKCPAEVFAEAEDYNALREPAGLTIALGGVLAAVGGAFFFAAFTDVAPTSETRLRLGPGYVGIDGRF